MRAALARLHYSGAIAGARVSGGGVGVAAMAKKRSGEPPSKATSRTKRGRTAKEAPAAAEQPAAAIEAAAAAASMQQAPPSVAPAAAADKAGSRQFFLMKSEPDVFSIDDLSSRPGQTEPWDGVRSHQAKKVLQSMRLGDQAFFYHSNAKPPGIVGIVEIVREAYPDHTQWDPKSKYYDASTSEDSPKWYMVDCKLVRKLARPVSLEELKRHKDGALSGMHLFKYGRLSVQAVQLAEWEFVLGLEAQQGAKGA